MSEVFIAYKRDIDTGKASFIRAKLEALGVTVFHDIDVGQYSADCDHYSNILECRLQEASAVLVLWTQASMKSIHVKGEAEKGLNRRTLVSACFGDIDPRNLPVPFNGVQCHHLGKWVQTNSCKSDHECCNFLKTLGDKLGRPALSLLAEVLEDGGIELKKSFVRKYPNDPFAAQFREDIGQVEQEAFKDHLNALRLSVDTDLASKNALLAEFKARFDAQLNAFRDGDDMSLLEPEKRIVNLLPQPTDITEAQIIRLQTQNDALTNRISRLTRLQRGAMLAAASGAVCLVLLGVNLRSGEAKGPVPGLPEGRSFPAGLTLPSSKSASALCDALAAYEYDPDRPASSGWVKKHDKIAADDASSVCEQAVRSAPDGATKRRLLVQLGRAKATQGYYAAARGDIATAKHLYEDALDDWKFATELESGQANVVLGAYYRGSFAPSTYADTVKNSAYAWKYYWRAAELKNPFGLTMAAFYLLFPEDYDNAVQPNYSKAKEYLDLAGPSNLAITTLAQGLAKFHGRGYEPADQVEGIRLISSAACKGEGDAQMFFNKYRNYKQLPCSL